MIELIKEPMAYTIFLAGIAGAAYIWDKLDKWNRNRKQQDRLKSEKRNQMRRDIRNKDYMDFYNIATRHINSAVKTSAKSTVRPIRKMTGYLSEEFYGLNRAEREVLL